MLRINAGNAQKYCDGLSRRSFVQLGVAGMAAVGLPSILYSKEASAAQGMPKKDTSVILIWLDGGPGHMDTYDMKPNAPAKYRGMWRPIRTNVPGIEFSEMFPLQAKVADKFSIVRSLHHEGINDHFNDAHIVLTGRGGPNGGNKRIQSPSIGAIVSKACGPRRAGLPAHAAVPYATSIGQRPGYFGASYVGIEHNPFETDGDPNNANFKVQGIDLFDGMSVDRLADRRTLLNDLDRMRRAVDSRGLADAMDRFRREAYQLVSGDAARKAFDIGAEDKRLRERYGRNSWGQSVLLARRLAEAGCTFVSVHLAGWDHHFNLQPGMESQLPRVDMAYSALLEDIYARGLNERILVVLCGEFSRTPWLNTGKGLGAPGRDHWSKAMFCLLAGGGLRGGQIVGATNRLGESPKERPVTVGDLHATIYHVLGIDPRMAFLNYSGRPVPALDEGQVISELI